MHKRNLYEAKAVTDNKKPNALRFPLVKSKRKQIEEDRLTEIEKENRLLLEKMTLIMQGEDNFAGFVRYANSPSVFWDQPHQQSSLLNSSAIINPQLNSAMSEEGL